jgi:hypothetical protein
MAFRDLIIVTLAREAYLGKFVTSKWLLDFVLTMLHDGLARAHHARRINISLLVII